jgi:hypothetical protein
LPLPALIFECCLCLLCPLPFLLCPLPFHLGLLLLSYQPLF